MDTSLIANLNEEMRASVIVVSVSMSLRMSSISKN